MSCALPSRHRGHKRTARMRRYRLILRLLIAVVVLNGVRALGQETGAARTERQPLWKTDLREFGYEQFSPYNVRWMRLIVHFTDDNHVVIGWISPDAATLSRTKGSAFGVPAHLHVLILDAKTGRKLTQRDWSTPRSGFPVLFGIPDGKTVICTDNSLRLLSPNLDVVKEQELPDGATCQHLSYRQSPSKRTVLTRSINEKRTSWELLNANTFATISTWTRELGNDSILEPMAISDHWMVGWCGQPTELSLCLRKPDEEWHLFRLGGLNSPAFFVSDELLAVGLRPGSVASIVSVQGSVLFQINLPKEHYLAEIVPSADGERFAAVDYRMRGLRSEPLDMYPFGSSEQALVYSLKDRRAIFALKVKGTSPWTPWHVHDNSVALSPNGTILAVLSDVVLSTYSVP